MSKPTLVRRLEILATLLEPTRRRLYRYVAAQLGSVSRDEAAKAIGVSRAMAAFHLDKLVESGLLRAEYRRLSGRTGRGAGRPAKLYRRSRRRFEVTLPARDHELLARLLAESIPPGADTSRAQDLAHSYGHSLGVRAHRRLSSGGTPERLAGCVADVMADLGFDPTPMDGDVRARNCPFDPLSRRLPDVVCHTAIALLRGVVEGVGARGLAIDRDERPASCCVVLRSADPGQPLRSDGSSARS